jgi:hypothetical protein
MRPEKRKPPRNEWAVTPLGATARSLLPYRPEEADGPAYGENAFTEVPQFAKSSLVPPQVARVKVNAEPVQLGYWM